MRLKGFGRIIRDLGTFGILEDRGEIVVVATSGGRAKLRFFHKFSPLNVFMCSPLLVAWRIAVCMQTKFLEKGEVHVIVIQCVSR